MPLVDARVDGWLALNPVSCCSVLLWRLLQLILMLLIQSENACLTTYRNQCMTLKSDSSQIVNSIYIIIKLEPAAGQIKPALRLCGCGVLSKWTA